MEAEITCPVCNSVLPEADNAVLCVNCDLYSINRLTWNSFDDFLDFLDGKKFVYRGLSIGFWCQGMKRSVKDLSNSIVTSLNVIEVKLAGLDDPEALIAISDLLEKLPNCSGIQIALLQITEHTAPYLAKLISFPRIRAVALQQATFSPESCQAFADALDPDRFLVLSLEECNIPTLVPIFKVLERSKIDMIPYLVERPLTDEEFSGFANVIKVNEHLKKIYTSNLANLHSRWLAEALQENRGVKEVAINHCELVTAIPAIVKLLQTTQNIVKFRISTCGITLALLTELCEGIQERKATTDLFLELQENGYTDNLEPIKQLLESNVNISGLGLIFGSSPLEWIQICESLKKNTTLRNISLSCLQANDEVIDALLDALKVNTTLRSLFLDTRWFSPIVEPLVKEIFAKNKLESVHISSANLTGLDFKTICNFLKKNYKLKKIVLSSGVPATEENVKILKELLEENCFITSCSLLENSWAMTKPYQDRNKKYQEEWTLLKANTLVLLHNLAQNADATRKMLLIDLWIEIFKRIRHPCSPANGFENAAKKIFNQYKLY